MEISTIKTRLPITDVLAHYGLKANKNDMLHCPFHNDKTPSLQIYPKTGTFCCFSTNCTAATGDQIRFIELKEQCTTHQAIIKAKELLNYTEPLPQDQSPQQLTKIAVLTKIFTTFKRGLTASIPAKKYAATRNIDISKTPVGFNNGQFHHGTRKDELLIQSCLKEGILSPNPSGGYFAWARYCIIFPLRNKENQIISLYGRSIYEDNKQRHYYLKGREGLYPHYPTPDTTTLILTESIIDCITLMQLPNLSPDKGEMPEGQRGNLSFLACYGANGFTEEHVTAIEALNSLHEIILFFDGDDAGRKGAQKIAEQLTILHTTWKISTINTPEGEDINSLIQSHQPEVFSHLIETRALFSFSTEKENTPSHPSPQPTPANSRAVTQNTLNTANPHRLTYPTTTAHYTINGGLKKEADSLRVSLVIQHSKTTLKHRSKVDLYEDKQVEKIAQEAAEKLALSANPIEQDLSRLTDLLETYREATLLSPPKEETRTAATLSPAQRSQCEAFLSKPGLINRLNELIGQAGVIGEETSRIFLFGIAASYKMADTLHALIQGSSGSGKTHLLVKISNFIPPEDCKRFTRVTESSFYNYGSHELTNKLICLEDLDGMKEEAFLAFRELQSRGMISSSTSGKDEQGNIRAFEKVVYGPIASLTATTKGEIYEDNMNRCFLIAVDESKEQTLKIIRYQNQRSAGQIDTTREEQITLFLQNCIRILRPYPVINPWADKINLPEEAHKIRRLNDLYQSYVKQITLLNQYSRQKDAKGRLITAKEDLETAATIMFESIILKIDELDGSLRLFYERLKTYVKSKSSEHHETYRFSQREIRQALHISKTQLHRYIHDLSSLEYIKATGGYPNTGFEYKIIYWDNITALKSKVKRHLQGQLDQLELPTG